MIFFSCFYSCIFIVPHVTRSLLLVRPALFSTWTGAGKYRTSEGRFVEIRNVWADNLEQEMVNIRELVELYPYVAMVSFCGRGGRGGEGQRGGASLLSYLP